MHDAFLPGSLFTQVDPGAAALGLLFGVLTVCLSFLPARREQP